MIIKKTVAFNIEKDQNDILTNICKKFKIDKNKIKYFKILKKSLDARDKNNLKFIYSFEYSFSENEDKKEELKIVKNNKKVLVVGFGPSGIFSALNLVKDGFNVIVVERGKKVEDRQKDIDDFINERKLNINSNIQFGEGGAGTFSDGKLNTGVRSEYKEEILKEFVENGAPDEILYINRPHIGSDYLPKVISNIRNKIINLGGEIRFSTQFINFIYDNNKILKAKLKNLSTGDEYFEDIDYVVLAIGHSSRDTYRMLYKNKVEMVQKDIAVGFRIEHLQQDINKNQFGKFFNSPFLKPAEYKLTSNISKKGVYTFCMCPGGVVVPATSEENHLVINGMSNFQRNGLNANSAIVCQIKKEEYKNDSPLGGIFYIEEIEKKAFIMGGSNYAAPCQLVEDFLEDRMTTSFKKVKPTYPLGTKFSMLKELLNEDTILSIKESLVDMSKKIKGFSSDGAILTGVETRTSSPCRIIRNDNFTSPTYINLFPVGEIGYAGGIMSSCIDGINIAKKIKKLYNNK